ncbi:hypothetical protein HAX54_031995 [Datura stramonium]|uniref:Uncharacterized protein n=1 Tax=Datura stramonium TaxID=4076 RepID=A0ABS8VDK2_DATST|nr:hypothetical protein [Datura stramonium]
MKSPSASPSMEHIPMDDEAPPSTQGELPSAVSETAHGVTTMDNTSGVKYVEDDDDDDIPLSVKWERPKIVKSASFRKHIVIKTSPPKRPRTRGALRRQVELKAEKSSKKN